MPKALENEHKSGRSAPGEPNFGSERPERVGCDGQGLGRSYRSLGLRGQRLLNRHRTFLRLGIRGRVCHHGPISDCSDQDARSMMTAVRAARSSRPQ